MLAAVSAALSGRVADRIGSPALLGVPGGILLALGASFYLRLPAGPEYLSHFLPGSILTGIGVGLSLPALTGSALLAVPGPALATGVATSTAFRQIGGALGVATFVAVHGTPGPNGLLAAVDRSFLLVAGCGLAAAAVLAVLELRLRASDYADAREGARAASRGAPASGPPAQSAATPGFAGVRTPASATLPPSATRHAAISRPVRNADSDAALVASRSCVRSAPGSDGVSTVPSDR
jgi:hypothetical protein